MPAVVPTDAGFAVHHHPGAMRRPERLPGLAVPFQSDIERAVVSIAHLPLTNEMVPAGHRGTRGALEFDAFHVPGGNARPVSIFEDDCGWSLEVDARDIRDLKILPVAIFENDDHRSMVVGRRGASPGNAAGCSEHEYGKNPERFDCVAHGRSPSEP